MAHPHASLIETVGGHLYVAHELNLPAKVTRNWLERGIAWPYRKHFARIARRKRVRLPEDFLAAVLAPADAAD